MLMELPRDDASALHSWGKQLLKSVLRHCEGSCTLVFKVTSTLFTLLLTVLKVRVSMNK